MDAAAALWAVGLFTEFLNWLLVVCGGILAAIIIWSLVVDDE